MPVYEDVRPAYTPPAPTYQDPWEEMDDWNADPYAPAPSGDLGIAGGQDEGDNPTYTYDALNAALQASAAREAALKAETDALLKGQEEAAKKAKDEEKKNRNRAVFTANAPIPGLAAPGNKFMNPVSEAMGLATGTGAAEQAGVNYTRGNPFEPLRPEDAFMRPQQEQYTFNTAPVEWMSMLSKLEDNKEKKKEAR